MKIGSLFSGGGLGDFGFLMAGFEIAWQVEIDEYCQKILALRYPESKKYRDIKTLKGADLEPVDIITGGFPCQPFSVAGKQKGTGDDRYLWPEMFRIIKECRPRWVVGENVPGIINLSLDTICADLESEGYEVRPIVFPSHALGAWHKRDRLWIIANTRLFGSSEYEKQTTRIEQLCEAVSDSPSRRCEKYQSINQETKNISFGCEGFRKFWEVEPSVGRVAHGVTDRIHRLKMLGNGQTPCSTYVIGKFIEEIETQ